MARDENKKDTGSLSLGLSPKVEKWSRERAEGFYRATQRKGMPMTYGAGKEPVKIPKLPKRGREPDGAE